MTDPISGDLVLGTDEDIICSPSSREEEDALRRFIEQYELSPELWNPANPSYSKKAARNAALDLLIPYLKRIKPGTNKREDVKKKINSLRTNFRKELKKIAASKRSARSADEVYTPSSWVYYALLFLERFEKPVQQTEPAVEQELEQEEDGTQSQEIGEHTQQTSAISTASTSSMLPPPSPLLTPRNKKPRMQGPISKQTELLQKACTLLETSSNPDSNIPTIAKAWGEKLLTLECKQRVFAEKAINDILFEATLGTLHRDSVKINMEHEPPRSSDHSQHASPSSFTTFNYSSSSPSVTTPPFEMHLQTEDISLFQNFKGKEIKMSKDNTLLEGVSDYFTEETLKHVLQTICGGKDIELLRWEFDVASAKGDSYLSTVNKIKVIGLVDGKQEQVSIVVKSLPKNLGRRNTFRSVEFFHNEITFYTKIIPKFKEFLKEKGQSQLLSIPLDLASHLDGENDYIALQDVKVFGFGPVSRQNCINVSECTMILQSMAKFHAVSFAYKDNKKEEFNEMMETLRETYFKDSLWSWYERFHQVLLNIAKDVLASEYPGSEAEKRFLSYKFGDLFKKCVDFCNRKYAPTSIITQGDSWAPNFLARNHNGVEDAIMLDFQLARCSSPVLDVSFSIYSCTDNAFREQHFDEMLKIYHNELSNSIALLGSDPQKLYPWNTFMEELKEQFVFGLVFALEAIPFSLLDESEAFDLDTLIKDDNAINIADVWKLPDIKTKAGRLRLADVIVHAVEKGFL